MKSGMLTVVEPLKRLARETASGGGHTKYGRTENQVNPTSPLPRSRSDAPSSDPEEDPTVRLQPSELPKAGKHEIPSIGPLTKRFP
jgi:hypothetical protein